MAWDESYRERKVKIWELAFFISLPVLVATVVIGEILSAAPMLLGFIFLLIPFAFVGCVVAFDDLRRRLGFWTV